MSKIILTSENVGKIIRSAIQKLRESRTVEEMMLDECLAMLGYRSTKPHNQRRSKLPKVKRKMER